MPPPTKRRKTENGVAEQISFDPAARREYLTGFHKRKLERTKQAKEVAEKKARDDRLRERREVRHDDNLRSQTNVGVVAPGKKGESGAASC